MTSVTAPMGLAAAVAVVLVSVVSGCGGSKGGGVAELGSTAGQSGAPAPAASAQGSGALAFAACMRSHGVPRFPDPDSSGKIPKVGLDRLGVAGSRFQAAQGACGHLLPNGGRPPNQAQLSQVKAQGLAYARCVRAQGVRGFPDPNRSGRIPDPARAGIDQGSPKFEAANRACGKLRPPYMPSNAAYNAWARTHPGG